MRAAVVDAPGGPEVLVVKEVPDPEPRPGWVLIRVHAFGLNRSEMFTRQGHSPGVAFPRVLGIECVGEVIAAPSTPLSPGDKVAALMGGMGRVFDGGYAEQCLVPASSVVPIDSDLPWSTLGALPEMFQTANGSLTVGLGVQPQDKLLVRGGTSSVGTAAIRIAKNLGLTVVATTRNAEKAERLKSVGADHVIIDDGYIADTVHAKIDGGVNAVLELIGTKTLHDSLRCVARGGTVCVTGILGNAWTLDGVDPMELIPTGVKLTCYRGGAADLDRAAFVAYLADLAAGTTEVNIDRVFTLDDIAEAHRYMESNQAMGKLVVEP